VLARRNPHFDLDRTGFNPDKRNGGHTPVH
jgi:hypothetical protein